MFELKQCEHVYSNIKHQAAILSTNIPHPSHKALKIKGARVHQEENKGHLLWQTTTPWEVFHNDFLKNIY